VAAVPALPGSIAAAVRRVLIGHTAALAHGIAHLALSCPASSAARCSGRLAVLVGNKVIGIARFAISPGRRTHLRVRLRKGVRNATIAVKQAQPGLPSLAVRRAVVVRGGG
jgi:hypothetical protein